MSSNTNPLAGTAHLLDELDSRCPLFEPVLPWLYNWIQCNRLLFCKEKLMVLLRDGRTLIGYLRCVDQFANLVLHKTIERIHVGKEYGDIPRGIFIVRGENVVLLGEIVCIAILIFKMLLILCCNTIIHKTSHLGLLLQLIFSVLSSLTFHLYPI